MFLSFSHFIVSSEEAAAVWTVKMPPMLERIRFGLYISVSGSQIITASTPEASALRSIAPRLPGFSTDSRTTTRGFSFIFRSSRLWLLQRSSAITPSVLPRYATFSYMCFGMEKQPNVFPDSAVWISFKASSERMSIQTNKECTEYPVDMQCSNSLAPSTTKSPSRRLALDFSCNSSSVLIFGFWGDVIDSNFMF